MSLMSISHYQREEANIAGSFESEEVLVSDQQQGDKRKRNIKISKKNEKQDNIKDISFL